ncbi:Short-chain-enoyl-CoA hydratase [bacterium HR08]|nr:Short-chain-enoyl-CoA hydratase [bacterium HR08]
MSDGLTHLRVERRRGYWVAVLDCARGSAPGAPNVLSLAALADVQALVEEVERQRDIVAVILTGTETGGFAAGADLHELHRLTPQEAFAFSRRCQLLFRRIERARPLFIAAIDGYCIGGGMDLALACDLRYATTRSVFAHPGARLGLLTGWGGTARLPRALGRIEALRLFLTAEPISAAEALRLGLIHQMTDGDVLALACRRAEVAVRLGPHAVSHVKEVLGASTEYP